MARPDVNQFRKELQELLDRRGILGMAGAFCFKSSNHSIGTSGLCLLKYDCDQVSMSKLTDEMAKRYASFLHEQGVLGQGPGWQKRN